MTVEPKRASALAHRAADLARLPAVEVAFLTQVDLRVGSGDAAALGLPIEPNTVARTAERSALWLGPDEWLVTSRTETALGIIAGYEEALAGMHHAAVDVSANRAVLDLPGPGTRELLASGCGLDLHPRAWRDGACAQTIFAHAQVILEQRGDTTRLFVRPSFGDYMVDRLLAG